MLLLLLLRKRVYFYEYMDEWEKFTETKLPEKEECYSNLNMEDIKDFEISKSIKDFEIKNVAEFHDFYLKSDTFPLAEVFENLNKNVFKNLSFQLLD